MTGITQNNMTEAPTLAELLSVISAISDCRSALAFIGNQALDLKSIAAVSWFKYPLYIVQRSELC